MNKKWVESARGRTFYWISRRKNAPCMVLLHGLAADHTLFDKQVAYFQENYSIVLWDAPAHGESRPYEDFSLLHCAVELKRILDAEKLDKVVLIGHDMGAWVAQVFIAHWPERILGFVSISGASIERRYYSAKAIRQMRRAGGIMRHLPFHMAHCLLSIKAGRSFYARANMRMALERYSRRELCALIRSVYTALSNELVANEECSCPAMLLLGQKDTSRHLLLSCEAWSADAKLPLYKVRSAGHNANADAPQHVNRLLHAFINSLPKNIKLTVVH